MSFLISSGMKPQQLSGAGYGEFDPVAPNDTPENRARNRRIEIVLEPNLADLPAFEACRGRPESRPSREPSIGSTADAETIRPLLGAQIVLEVDRARRTPSRWPILEAIGQSGGSRWRQAHSMYPPIREGLGPFRREPTAAADDRRLALLDDRLQGNRSRPRTLVDMGEDLTSTRPSVAVSLLLVLDSVPAALVAVASGAAFADGVATIRSRATFQAFWTTQDIERSRRVAPRA